MPVEQPSNYLGCDLNKLLAASACLQWCISEEDRMALEIYVRCAELAVDDTNYIAPGGVTQLLADAKQWVGKGTLNCTNRQAVALYIDLVNAINEGAALTVPKPQMPQEAMCFRCLDPETKRNLILYLKCRLNSIDEPE